MITTQMKDRQTVTPEGKPVQKMIEGVVIGRRTTLTDDRGTLCEILGPHNAVNEAPLVYVYQFTIRPGKCKGWHVHYLHDDRIFVSQGHVKVVLYDNRPDSPTYGLVNEIYRTELDRTVMVIPRNVFHAHENVGTTDALFVSMPTRAYQHDDPDVHRLPLDTDLIPYQFVERRGG